MWVRACAALLLGVVIFAGAASAQLRPRPTENPEEFTTETLDRVEKGDLEGLARIMGFALGVDISDGQLESRFKQLAFAGAPQFFDRVYDRTLGQSLRQMIFYAPFRNERQQLNYIFFNFIFMRTESGWYLTHFQFDRNVNRLIPQGWISVP